MFLNWLFLCKSRPQWPYPAIACILIQNVDTLGKLINSSNVDCSPNCAQWPCLEMILIKPCFQCQHFQVPECKGRTKNFFCTQSQHSCSCFPNTEKSRNTSVSTLRCWKHTKKYASNSFTQIDTGMSGPKHRQRSYMMAWFPVCARDSSFVFDVMPKSNLLRLGPCSEWGPTVSPGVWLQSVEVRDF